MKVVTVEANDLEIERMEEEEQWIGMFLEKGAFELGLNRASLTRATYDAGDLFIFPRQRQVFVRRIDAHYMFVRVSDAALRGSDEKPDTVRIQCQRHLDDRRVQGLMVAINAERLEGFPSGRLFIDSIELSLGAVLRQIRSDYSIPMRNYQDGLTPVRLRKVIELMHENIQCDLSLQALADTAGLSVSHFSRMFRKSTGLSPHQYFLRRRIHSARELLRGSDDRVLDVASACGFKTQQHFARAFRREFGVNPTEYRRL